MENPKCPYCGSIMKYDFNNNLETHWLYCPKCGSRSPVVSYDDDPYAAAMKRDRVKGEWIDKFNKGKMHMQSFCSVCGKRSGIGGIESNRHKPFCPNCGVEMKEEKQDENDRSNNKN